MSTHSKRHGLASALHLGTLAAQPPKLEPDRIAYLYWLNGTVCYLSDGSRARHDWGECDGRHLVVGFQPIKEECDPDCWRIARHVKKWRNKDRD